MKYLLTASQMKAADHYTIEKLGIPSLVLMERASLACARYLYSLDRVLSPILILCGSGNNGGDGFALARILSERKEEVIICFTGRETSLTPECRTQKEICENLHIKMLSWNDLRSGQYENYFSVIVDAMLGIGLSRELKESYKEIIDWANSRNALRFALDIPSGVHADDGRIMGTAFMADHTVTFQYLKRGQLLYPGTSCCQKLICENIGIFEEGLKKQNPELMLLEKNDLQDLLPRKADSHKGSYGKLLLIAGSEGMSGAACMAALSALRSGCGMVRVLTCESNRIILQSLIPEAMISTYVPERLTIEFPDKMLTELLSWADVIAAGPGLGMSDASRMLVEAILSQAYCKKKDMPLLLDADALNLISACKMDFLAYEGPIVLTPHVGELKRLLDSFAGNEISGNIVETTQIFAAKLNEIKKLKCSNRFHPLILVRKDSRTLISDGKAIYMNTFGNSGMATAGSGDVLAGLISSLLAQHNEPLKASALGVLIHALAGDEAAARHGQAGMIATDMVMEFGHIMS